MPRRKDRPRLKVKFKIEKEQVEDGKLTNENGVPSLPRISSASIVDPVISLCSSQEVAHERESTDNESMTQLQSDWSSPPELIKGNLDYITPERVQRKPASVSKIIDEDDYPLSKVRMNLKRKLKEDKNEPVSSYKPSPTRESLSKTAPAIAPLTNGSHIPKFNIVHADKTKKLAQSSMNLRNNKRIMRSPSPRSPSPLKFALVLQNGNNRKPRGRPRKTPAKPIRQDSDTQTSDGKINRMKDLCCEGCEKNLTLLPSSQDSIDNVILERSLEICMQLVQPTRKAIKNKCKETVQQVQTCNVFKTRMAAPTHKVPTIGLKSKPSIEMPTLERISDVGADTTLDSNTKEVDMDVESNPDTQLPKLTFIQQQPSHPFHPLNNGPQDFLKTDRLMPSLIPQGNFMSKKIVKRDDVARIGQFMELYDNPKRPKLLEVEHPPEEKDANSLIKSNIAFFGEFEPETPAIDPESELLNVFNDISDDDGAKFSSDDEGAQMSDTNSVAAINSFEECDDDFDVDEILNEYEKSEPQEFEDTMSDIVSEDQGVFGIDVDVVQETPPPTPEEPANVSPKQSLEAEMMKNFNKTPLEMIEDELDYDFDDIESPAYEHITANQSLEDILLASSSSDSSFHPDSECEQSEIEIMDEPNPIANEPDPLADVIDPLMAVADQLEDVHMQIMDQSDPPVEKNETTPEQCQNDEPQQWEHEQESGITMEMPDISSEITPEPDTLATENSDVLSENQSVPCLVDASPSPVFSFETSMSEETLKACTNTFLTAFYEYCVEDRQRFMEHFPMIAKEMGAREMTCDIMKALRACENLHVLSHYKHIVDALILAGMQKQMAVKYLCDNHLARSKEATDLLIDIILEYDCADDVMEYLEGIAKQNHYSFNSSSLDRLLPQAIKTGKNIRWTNFVKDIISNLTSRRSLYKNKELTKQTMAWLQDKEDNETDTGISEANKRETSVWGKTIIIRNQDFKVPKAMPNLIPIVKRK